MHLLNKSSVLRLMLAGLAGTLVGCGGGGGGGGDGDGGGIVGGPTPTNEYVVSLQASQTALPLNIAGVLPGTGVNAPYSTVLNVSARRKTTGDVIPGGADIFGCSVLPGIEFGALYYLDGDTANETDQTLPDGTTIKVPRAFRSVTLDANAGGASFHFHAGNTAGTARITCAVTDPLSNRQESASVDIAVGLATTVASQVQVTAASPGFLFVQGINQQTQLLLQVQVLDDTGQSAPNPAAGISNLSARIVPSAGLADDNAVLRSPGVPDGSAVTARSINGQAQFTLISGANPGPILLEVVADRADNNVSNGIAQPVTNFVRVDVVDATVFQIPLSIVGGGVLPQGTTNLPYAPVILNVAGGTPPYTWSVAQGSLPAGMTLQTFGVITGTPTVAVSSSFVARVTDSNGVTGDAVFALRVIATP